MSSTTYPLLILGGSNDMITPFWMAEELHGVSSSSDKQLVKIAGGTHNNLPSFEIYRNRLNEFISNIVR